MCAMKAGMSRKTAGKYLSQDKVLEQRRVTHTWETRKEPLTEIWPNALFEHLIAGVPPAKFEEKHLRTFQRRARDWRLANGPGKEVFFTQNPTPGKVLAMDRTSSSATGFLRAFQLANDGGGRRTYAAWLKTRATHHGGEIDEEAILAIRLDWYLGKDRFKDKLLIYRSVQPARRIGGICRAEGVTGITGKKAAQHISRERIRHLGLPPDGSRI